MAELQPGLSLARWRAWVFAAAARRPFVAIACGLGAALQILVFTLVLVLASPGTGARGDGWYIAYIGRYSNPDFDVLHERALRHFLHEPIAGREVELRLFDMRDRGGPDGSTREIYRELRADPNCLAVIDNTWGKHLAEAREVIRDAGFPVVSINGDCNDLDFGGHVVFLGHDERAADYIVTFLEQLRSIPGETFGGVVFLGEDQFPSTRRFRTLFERSELGVVQLKGVRTQELSDVELEFTRRDLDAAFDKLAGEGVEHAVLVMNVHADWGEAVIRHVTARESPRVTMIGGEYIFSNAQAEDFDGSLGHRLLLVTSPSDAISQRAALATGSLSRRYGARATQRRNAGLFVQRCGRALGILRTLLDQADQKTGYKGAGRGTIHETRAHLLARFESLRDRSMLVEGQRFQFDEHLRFVRDTRLQLLDHGLPRSFPHQLVRHSEAEQAQGKPAVELAPNMYIGVHLEDISDIDLSEGTFFADFLLSVSLHERYQDVLPISPDAGIWYASGNGPSVKQELFRFRNERREDRFERVADIKTGDIVGHIYRCTGVFSNNYQTGDYPFDTQLLSIDLELKTHGQEVTLSFDDDSFGSEAFRVDPAVVRGWRYRRIFGGIDQAIAYGTHDSAGRLTRFTFNIEVGRGKLRPIGTLVLPLLGIGLCSVMVLFLRNLAIDRVGEISVGTFIGFIAYVIFYTEIAPRSSVVTHADWLFYATFAVTLLQLLLVVAGNVLFSPAAMRTAPKIPAIAVGRWVVAAGYAASISVVLWRALGA